MTVGLTSEQMMSAFFDSVGKNADQTLGQFSAAETGENPRLATQIQQMVERFPGFPPEALGVLGVLLKSFTDIIEANNHAIAQVVPHVEPNR